MEKIKILYITKLKNTKTNGVTVAVHQLMDAICNYAQIGWLDLGKESFDVDEKIEIIAYSDLDHFNADIAVIEDPFNTLEFCKIAKKLKKSNTPYILAPHGCFTKVALQKNAMKKFVAIHLLLRRYLKGCCATQYLCENEKSNSIQFNESLVIPNGVPIDNSYSVRKTIKNIVFISRKDVRHKGIDFLLKAVCLQRELLESEGVKVYIYGSVESRDDELFINEFIRKNDLSNIVSNHGPIFGEKKKDVLMKSDLFILTSRHEGFPLSILEALSYGLPVLITKGTNIDNIVSDANAGWTCETDETDISRALKAAISCQDCTCYSENARRVSLEYSWEAVACKTIKEYRELLIRNGAQYE